MLVDLPPRIASLGCALDAIKALPSPVALPEPAGESTILAATSSYVLVPDYLKTMKKEKTKSKVWGMLTRGKSTKNKTESNDAVPVALLNKEESKLAFQREDLHLSVRMP